MMKGTSFPSSKSFWMLLRNTKEEFVYLFTSQVFSKTGRKMVNCIYLGIKDEDLSYHNDVEKYSFDD